MKTRVVTTIAILLLVTLLGGCINSDERVQPGNDAGLVEEPFMGLEVEHERGTAAYGPGVIVRDHARQTCATPGTTIASLCYDHVVPALDELPQVSQADPAVDILGATFSETSTEFLVAVQLAGLQPGWEHVDEGVSLYYDIGWINKGNETEEAAMARFHVENKQGIIQYEASYWRFSADCNDWFTCGVRVPVEIEYGQPGKILLAVPRTTMPHAESADRLEVKEVSIWQQTQPEATMTWSLHHDPLAEDGWSRPGQNFFLVDIWRGEENFTFHTRRASPEHLGPQATSYGLAIGNTFGRSGEYRPDIDLQEITIEETSTTFGVSLQLGAVSETPDDHELWVVMGMPSGRVHMAGYDVVEGTREAYAGYENPPEDWRWVDVPILMKTESGEPGRITFNWNRMDLGSPKKGDALNLLWAWTNEKVLVDEEQAASNATVKLSDSTGGYDWAGEAPPYWFQNDTPPKTEESLGITITDEKGGTSPPSFHVDEIDEDQYDITYIQATGRDESSVHVALGIEDLSHVTVPRGYEAIIYSVGLQTDAGKFQAFYYKDNDQQGYYCATDTLSLTESPSNPNDVVLTPITGLQSHGGRNPGGGTAPSSGAMVFHVPHECLGMEDGETFQLHDLAGGTYLLEDHVGTAELTQVHMVDSAQPGPGDLPVLLGLEAVPTKESAEPAWYMAPLGLNGQDWDVMGIAVALLLATGGAFIVSQRRRKLRKYLNRVSHTAKIKDLTARETGLGELREALRADLISGKIAESHYTIVLRHIEDAMKHVRVKSIEETFRELPFHIVSKLRAVLNDGVITQDEREMVVDLVERANIPTNDKQKMLSRLERWQMVDEVARP